MEGFTLAGLLVGHGAFPQSNVIFGVSGFATQDQFDTATHSLIQTDRIDFSVLVWNSKYLIRTTKLYTLLPNEVAELVTGSDGTDAFSIGNPSEPNPTVWVSSGVLSHHLLVHENSLWLAYCSSFLLEHDPTAPPLRDSYLLDYSASEVRTILDRLVAFPHLPFRLRIVSPDYYIESDGRSARRLPLPAPYDKGYQPCAFQVLALINVNGLRIPGEFTVEKYVRKTSGATNANDLILKSRLRFVATNVVASIMEDQVIPRLSYPARALDFRFRKSVSFSYTVMDSPLRSKSDPVVIEAFNARIKELRAERLRNFADFFRGVFGR